ncbi:hypothetical protein M153_113700001, partial [Pseudoloma neurophilia]
NNKDNETTPIYLRKHTDFCVNNLGYYGILFNKNFYYFASHKIICNLQFNQNITALLTADHPNEVYICLNKHLFIFNCENKKITNLCYLRGKPKIIKKWENGLFIICKTYFHIFNRLLFKDQNSIISIFHSIISPNLNISDSYFIIHDINGTFFFIDKITYSVKKIKFKFNNFIQFCSKNNIYIFLFKNYDIIITGEIVNFNIEEKMFEFRKIFIFDKTKNFFRFKNVIFIFKNNKKVNYFKRGIKNIYLLEELKRYMTKKRSRINITTSYLYTELNGAQDDEEHKSR